MILFNVENLYLKRIPQIRTNRTYNMCINTDVFRCSVRYVLYTLKNAGYAGVKHKKENQMPIPNWKVFDLVFFVYFIIGFFIRSPHERNSKKANKTKTKKDSLEVVTVLLVAFGGILFPLVYWFTPLFNFANYEINLWAGIAGSIIGIFGLLLFWIAHSKLGIQFSPGLEIKESHILITDGIYSQIRHPMYSAYFLTSLSQLLLIGNWFVGPAFFISFSILYIARVKREESFMVEQFGQSYQDYILKTKRLIPKIL